MVIFRANFAWNWSVLRWSYRRFYCFSNRGHHLLFQQQWMNNNEPIAKPLTSWLVPSFSQQNLRLVLSERCFIREEVWTKIASLRQVNTPSSWDKFQNCCTDMYLIRFLPNFAVFCVFLGISRDFADLREFRGSATARNIRSPVNM